VGEKAIGRKGVLSFYLDSIYLVTMLCLVTPDELTPVEGVIERVGETAKAFVQDSGRIRIISASANYLFVKQKKARQSNYKKFN
jgi:hypothetical protein